MKKDKQSKSSSAAGGQMQQMVSLPPEQWEHCPNCPDAGCYPEGGGMHYVTRDMAIDAGMPEIEGEPMYEEPTVVQCEFCWTNPKSAFYQKNKLWEKVG